LAAGASDNRCMAQSSDASAEEVRIWDRPAVMVPLFAFISVIGGLFGSFTLRANLLVLAMGGTLLWLAFTGRTTRRPPPRRLSRAALWWLVPLLLLALTELYSFSHASRPDYPTISLLADPVLEHYVPRAAAYFGWLTGFWSLVRR
jgi:hypothetical protein